MGEKRRDNKKRLLQKGEGQRSDGKYYYRYKLQGDTKWRYIYASSLATLRERKVDIEKAVQRGCSYVGGQTTVAEAIERYLGIKKTLSVNSKRAYGTALNRIKEDPIIRKKISNVKVSDAKEFCVRQFDRGFSYNTISGMKNILSPAFQMAVDDDYIYKNPFRFNLSDVIPKTQKQRQILSQQQEADLLSYELQYSWYASQKKKEKFTPKKADEINSYYNAMVILLGAGMRISEMCGLTLDDVDFEENCIYINKQLCRTAEKLYYVTPPKSDSGNRVIPMSEDVRNAFQSEIKKRRPLDDFEVDGYRDFIFLTPRGYPQLSTHMQTHMNKLVKWIQDNKDPSFPKITPHALRHTFCSRMQKKIDLKCLQYLMGHSSADVTLDVYSHVSVEDVKAAFNKAVRSS